MTTIVPAQVSAAAPTANCALTVTRALIDCDMKQRGSTLSMAWRGSQVGLAGDRDVRSDGDLRHLMGALLMFQQTLDLAVVGDEGHAATLDEAQEHEEDAGVDRAEQQLLWGPGLAVTPELRRTADRDVGPARGRHGAVPL